MEVVEKPKGAEGVYSGGGKMMNSACDAINVDGLNNVDAGAKIVEYVDARGLGYKKTNYKLRDWLFARQRYWGEPFPVVFPEDDPNTAVPIPESELPLVLPETDNFKPSGGGEGPLANCDDWVRTVDPRTGKPALRETNTMPQWAGSCWYYLRFIDPSNEDALIDVVVGKVLASGGFIRRRRRTRGATLALRAVLAQSAVRYRRREHKGTVPAFGVARDDFGRG